MTLSPAIKATEGVSCDAGLIYERADVTLSKAIDFGTAICASGNPANCFTPSYPFKPQQLDGTFEVSGDSTSVGYVVGAQIAPNDKLAIGISHRSEIKHDLEGTLDYTVPGAAATALAAAGRTFPDGDGGARLVTPAITTLSIKYGFTDSFRAIHPDEVKYSWWSYRFHAREKNAGWRIDYFIVSRRMADKIRAAEIHNEIFGSDHCPASNAAHRPPTVAPAPHCPAVIFSLQTPRVWQSQVAVSAFRA